MERVLAMFSELASVCTVTRRDTLLLGCDLDVNIYTTVDLMEGSPWRGAQCSHGVNSDSFSSSAHSFQYELHVCAETNSFSRLDYCIENKATSSTVMFRFPLISISALN